MPHIPRSMAPSGLVDPAMVPRAPRRKTTNQKPPVPFKGGSKQEPASGNTPHTGNQLVGKLSMKDWDVDPLRVMQHIFGKEIKTDEHSGLVSGTGNGSAEGRM